MYSIRIKKKQKTIAFGNIGRTKSAVVCEAWLLARYVITPSVKTLYFLLKNGSASTAIKTV